MSSNELKDNIVNFLKEHNQGALATCIGDDPRSSPVLYFLASNMNIYIPSAGGEKFNAIDSNPNVCLLVNTDYVDFRQIKGVQIFGKAITNLQKPSLVDEAKQQCMGIDVMKPNQGELMVIKVIPEEVVYLDSLGDGDRTKQILRLDRLMEENNEYR